MANDNATERVNSALAVLRSELSEIRDQDVQLMKQLLNINDSIKELSKKQTNPKRVRISKMGRRPLSTNMFISPELTTIDEDNISNSSSDSDCDSDECTNKDIFRTNVKLWKCRRYCESDSH